MIARMDTYNKNERLICSFPSGQLLFLCWCLALRRLALRGRAAGQLVFGPAPPARFQVA